MRKILVLFLCGFMHFFSVAQQPWRAKVDGELLSRLSAGERTDFLVVLQSQADLAFATQLKTKEEKGQYVYRQLLQLAEKRQGHLRSLLEESAVDFRPFFLVNAIQVSQGNLSLVEKLASLPDVGEIQPDPWVKIDEPDQMQAALQLRSEVTWGLEKINAPQVWEMGFKGQGVVIAGQDTGYEWDHPSLINSYRGWEDGRVDHNYHWHDAIHELSPLHNDPSPDPERNPCGLDSRIPCDDHNHGTHTMGTMTGNNQSGVQIGVAPSARWIGCRNMERGWGRPSTYIECFEWFLAPTNLENNEPDPRLAPHVINNSWGCPDIEGCNPGNWALMERAVENLRAAGIVVVVSAGNSGSRGCGSVTDAPAFFEGSFSVGASAADDDIAGFSSRGPVVADGSRRLKPNVVAPGVGVLSATRNGRYASWQGTSMAGPHVAGAVAVVISANPQLAGQVGLIEAILEQSAKPLASDENCEDYSGQKTPNPVFGYGRIDLLAAVKKAQEIYIAPEIAARRLGLRVFPNPIESEAIFQLDEWPGELQWRLMDAMGREVQSGAWTESEGLQKRVDLRVAPGGIYFFRLFNERRTWTETLVKP